VFVRVLFFKDIKVWLLHNRKTLYSKRGLLYDTMSERLQTIARHLNSTENNHRLASGVCFVYFLFESAVGALFSRYYDEYYFIYIKLTCLWSFNLSFLWS